MTVEMVLIVAVWAYILIGVFFGDLGPIEVFRDSAPKLAAHIEKGLAIGHGFKSTKDGKAIKWGKPLKK